MRVSYRWLTELLPKLNRDPLEVAEALSAVGLAVDGIVDHESALRPVLLASVVAVAKHPTRENLSLVTIRTTAEASSGPMASLPPSLPGSRIQRPSEELTVVCGAKNVPPPGHLVVFAGLGAKLPGVDFVLAPRDIGGVPSEGMLCSEAELGLAPESDGLFVLPPGAATAGTRFIDVFPEARDVVFELDITPNRPDALGHVGVARDLGAFFEYDLVLPPTAVDEESGAPSSSSVVVDNRAPERCPRYAAAVVRGVRVGPSPDTMRWRLHRLGVRAISNVVDVTNWLLLEYGQPLHAFDLTKVRGASIVIRGAQEGETMTTLDGVARKLTADDLVIADRDGPTALAGIMGGADSEVGGNATEILLESAYFAPRGVRRTARRHAMHTESSHRFERGVDHGANEVVLARARRLLAELCGGKVAPGIVTANGEPLEVPKIEFRSERMDQLLGVDVPFKEATRVLSRLGFVTEFVRDTKTGHVALVRGASHRPDVAIEADLVEEVARIRGLDNIPTVLPSIPPQEPRVSGRLERRVNEVAVGLGLSEALTYAFVAAKDLGALSAPTPVVTLDNPLTEERSVLRTTLLPGLLEALRRARRRGVDDVRLYTVGSVFLAPGTAHPRSEARPEKPEDRVHLPYEEPRVAFCLAGHRSDTLTTNPPPVDVFDAKGLVEEFVVRLVGREDVVVESAKGDADVAHLHPRGAARVVVGGVRVGTFGPLHPDVLESLDLGASALVVELSLAALESLGYRLPRYVPLPKLPAIERDLSLVVRDEQAAREVAALIERTAGELCESVRTVAEFRGGSVPPGHRSLTFRVVYRDPLARRNLEGARTLTDKEIDVVQTKVLETAKSAFGATLRA